MATKEMYELLKIGLTDGESKVYLALSGLGSSTVGPIVKNSKVAYSNIYEILNRLIDKGLVSFIIKSKTKYFQAAPPANLLKYLENKEKEIYEQKISLKEVLKNLEEIQKGKENQEAEVFIGLKGLRSAYEKLMKEVTKKDEVLFFYLHKEEYAEQSDMFYTSILDITKKAKNRGICNKKYKESSFAQKSKFLNIKFVEFPIPENIDIIRDKVMIVSWRPTPTAILIHSKSIAENFKEYFNQIWDQAKK